MKGLRFTILHHLQHGSHLLQQSVFPAAEISAAVDVVHVIHLELVRMCFYNFILDWETSSLHHFTSLYENRRSD